MGKLDVNGSSDHGKSNGYDITHIIFDSFVCYSNGYENGYRTNGCSSTSISNEYIRIS